MSSSTTTDFNQAPYNDDYNEDKNFHRILFKPKVPIQARELTQIQTILQDQIRRHGNYTFKDGSIIDGCNIAYIPKFDFVRLADYADIYDANTSSYNTNQLFDINIIADTIAEANNGLRAQVKVVKQGSLESYPDTNRVYVTYLNSVSNGTIKTFQSNERITFYASPRSANVIVARANTIVSNATVNTIGQGYGLNLGDGIVYQKGFFIKVPKQSVVVNNFSTNTGNCYVGFRTDELIITPDLDESLNDNALGYGNENAPGHDRLKLVSTLQTIDFDTADTLQDFTPIVTFIAGNPVQKGIDAQLNKLGEALAGRTSEESGDYYVNPFLVDTRPNEANTLQFQISVSPGIAYVSGNRIELVKTAFLDVDRGIDTNDLTNQLVSVSYGNYILVNELSGVFNFESLDTVTFYNAYQNALTNRTFSGGSATGSVVGTAKVRAIRYVSGTPGTPSAVYAVHISDIKLNSGFSISNIKSIVQSNAFADLTASVIYEQSNDNLLFNFGVNSIKKLSTSTGNNNTQYITRATTAATLAVNGSITISIPTSHGGGSDVWPYGVGLIGDGNENDFIIVTQSSAQTANLSGTVISNTSTANLIGSGTSFTTNFSVGEYVNISHGVGNSQRRIVQVTNNTHMVLDAAPATTNVTSVISKFFPNGYVIPLSSTLVGTRTINVISSSQAVVSIGLNSSANLLSSIPVQIHHNISRQNATPIAKAILKNRFVRIRPANNDGGLSGPWDLGIPDVHKIRGVYVGSGTYSNTNQNMVSKFVLDPGQTQSSYEHATLKPSGTKVNANTTILVELDYFVSNTTSGIGFYSVDSYPIDDANTANVNAITTAEIPVVKRNDDSVVSLRDAIDFRPMKVITASSTDNAAATTINPAKTTTYAVDIDGTYLPTPYQNFQTDLQYYQGRIDVVYFTRESKLGIKKGNPADFPKTPDYPKNSMVISKLYINPYPSLTSVESGIIGSNQNKTISPTSYTFFDISSKITNTLEGNKRYTMKDINVLDQRIQRLEYYTTLNMLEKAATDMQIPDENGLNRFKNGIFVDPFTSHENGQVNNPEYKIAIDSDIGEARPFYSKSTFDLDYQSRSNIKEHDGTLYSLNYTHRLQMSQLLASKFRPCAPLARSWNGTLVLSPGYSFKQDEKRIPAKNVTVDLAQPWEEFANSPFAQTWGEWRTTEKKKTVDGRTYTIVAGPWLYTKKEVTTTTTTSTSRTGQKLSVGTSKSKIDLGDHVTDVSLSPFISKQVVAFYATGMRPGTRVYPYFDDISVSKYCRPGVRNPAVTKPTDSSYVTPNGALNAPLITTEDGTIAGHFVIPEGTFRVGDRKFVLIDVDNLITGIDSKTTISSAMFTAGAIALTKQSETLTTINPVLSSTTITERGNTSVSTSSTIVTVSREVHNTGGKDDPIAQSFTVSVPDENVQGVFATKVDLYFKDRSDSNNGIRIYLVEMELGYPNGDNIIPYSNKWLPKSSVNISNNASVATTFTFDSPVFLANGKDYAIVIKPDGDDPDYQIWTAELGAVDIVSKKQITSQPNPGIFFVSANAKTWTAIQTEDLKYKLYTAKFTPGSTGTLIFSNASDDYLSISNINYVSANASFSPGNFVVKCTNTSVVNSTTVNTSVYGTVADTTELVDGILTTSLANGTFIENTLFQVHDTDDANISSISSSTLIGSFYLNAVKDKNYHAVSPRISNIQPVGTDIQFSWQGSQVSGNTYSLAGYNVIENEVETEFYDYTRVVASKSNEKRKFSSSKTAYMKCVLSTTNEYVSPVVDFTRKNVVIVENLIDPVTSLSTMTEEFTNEGIVQTKWISKPVVLADGQDSEDLEVYISAYRPLNTEILVFAKFLAPEDSETIENKTWTLLEYSNTGINTYSNSLDLSDIREWKLNLSSSILSYAPNTSAYSNLANSGIIRYQDSTGALYNSFSQFQLKFVLMANNAANVPRVSDIRAIALMR